jgi:hypothetical protein|tara:strand:+ start:175 stop:570 length:396 start_codon:yes stop_codon:yes gene_type:complete
MANPNIVSVSSIYGGNYGWALTNTLTTTLVTVDAEKLLKINRIVCTNIHATDAANLNLYVDGMGTAAANGLTPTGASATTYLAKVISVPANASLVVTDTPIYLLESDILKGGSSATSTLELFISYEVLDDA